MATVLWHTMAVVSTCGTAFLYVLLGACLAGVNAQEEACSVSSVLLDTCSFKYDGECDADTIYCSEKTDCYDCDPCRDYRESCTLCASQPDCGYCALPSGAGVCLSSGFSQALPTLCSTDGGTEWSTSSTQCSVNEVASTTIIASSCQSGACRYEYDLECDAGIYCDENTDCFDCDPCQAHALDCSQCISEGCQYGTLERTFLGIFTTSYPVCSSQDNAKNARSGSSFSISYQESCSSDDTTTTSPATYSCDYSNDSCDFAFDGECDAGTFVCRRNSDCFDCDPCQQYRFEGCDACTAAGCSWCAADAICLSPSFDSASSLQSSKFSCQDASDFVTSCTASASLSEEDQKENEPLFGAQSWVFDLINVREAWDLGYTGAGIGVRINDNGVDRTHKEIEGRFDVGNSCSVYRPASLNRKHSHGTAVASLVAGSAESGTCGVGVAYGATLSGCRILNSESSGQVAFEIFDSSVFYDNMERMHISQNSFGVPTCSAAKRRRKLQSECPFDNNVVCQRCSNVDWDNPTPNERCENTIAAYCKRRGNFEESPDACLDFLDLFTECRYNNLEVSEQAAFRRGVLQGRNGKGIIYVFASGNEHHSGADINMEGVLTSRYTLSVGAVDKSGLHASYSTGGAALHVVAPGGDSDHFTNNVVALTGGGCFDIGPGTSFAAPIVSGVVALMLEANEELTWRDVQGIVASTAKKVDPGGGEWTTNGAGLEHSYLYGFGIVDAAAAVKASLQWTSYPDEIQILAESGAVNISVPEYPGDSVISEVEISEEDIVVESVSVYLDLRHSSRGDLEVVLISPDETESILHPSRRPENSQHERWKLLSVRHWGERAEGTWSLRLVDHRDGDIDACVDKTWSVTISNVLEVDCGNLERSLVCQDGGVGPAFDSIFPGEEIDGESLRSEDGVTPDIACCVCGGGTAASEVDNVLLSWRLAVYGHAAQPVEAEIPTSDSARSFDPDSKSSSSSSSSSTAGSADSQAKAPNLPSTGIDSEDQGQNDRNTAETSAVTASCPQLNMIAWSVVCFPFAHLLIW